ncbi:tail completion protein gp17 [Polycladidibacter hongkongensis]|uniref:tail completion protein gp17 n=1 Tax=Polycladidibacter hongkongensis TaxID=1647556 RepID=UPI00083136E7|nr:DUF3168 domain-containing protein [Pseudovibrio hongkongensis]
MRQPPDTIRLYLHKLLAEDAALQTWLGTPPRIYDRLPLAATYPLVLIEELQRTPLDGDDPPLIRLQLRMSAVSRSRNAGEVEAIAERLAQVLQAAPKADATAPLLHLALQRSEIQPLTSARAMRQRLSFTAFSL